MPDDLTNELCLRMSTAATAWIDLLLDSGADVNGFANDGRTPLMYASGLGRLEVVRILLERGADVNLRSRDGETALHKASGRGRLNVVRLLIQAGADVNAASSEGVTPLMGCAMALDSEGVAKELIQAGADVNARTTEGETALSWTRTFHDEALEELLLAAGAKP